MQRRSRLVSCPAPGGCVGMSSHCQKVSSAPETPGMASVHLDNKKSTIRGSAFLLSYSFPFLAFPFATPSCDSRLYMTFNLPGRSRSIQGSLFTLPPGLRILRTVSSNRQDNKSSCGFQSVVSVVSWGIGCVFRLQFRAYGLAYACPPMFFGVMGDVMSL